MTKTDAAAGIGTPEGALLSCVSLIAAVFGQPEELTERYLDLYYQVRRAADTSSAPVGAPSPRGEGREKPAAKTGPSETRKKVDFDEVLASASAGAKMPPDGKERYAPFGKIKAEIRDRYIGLRAKGMTIAQTVTLSGGKVTETQILNIMNGTKVGMDAYNAIEDAMNKWEQTLKTAGQADSTTE